MWGRTSSWCRAAGAAVLAVGACAVGAPAASAGVGLGVVPAFPATIDAGSTAPGSLTLTNVSTASESVGSVAVTDIRLAPSCSSFDPECDNLSIADPGTFTLSATGVGAAGTACAGRTFTIGTANPTTGVVTFVPVDGLPVVLGAPSTGDADRCRIDFTVTADKVPNHDAFPGTPGVQTNQIATALATHENGALGSGTGSDVTTVRQASTFVVTQATPTAVVGTPVSDTATLGGGANPTGSVTFSLYGPNDPTCAGPPIFTDTAAVTGNGNVTSDPFTPTAPGTYQWIAAYSGDANNAPATSPCNAPNESTVVTQASPALTTQASGDVRVGGEVTDTATLSSGFNPTGTITFTLFGPNDPTCAGAPVFTSTVPVNGNGSYRSEPFTPTAPGTYRWIAAYSGDANNAAATSPCNAPGETVEVLPPEQREVDCDAAPPEGAIVGTRRGDRLRGTDGDDVIFGGGGHDKIDGRGGNDTICAGDGKDDVEGGPGDDTIDGGRDADELEGGSGDDTLRGRDGKDELEGGSGDDTLEGGDDSDHLEGGGGDDAVDGGDGRDHCEGGRGTNTLVNCEPPRRGKGREHDR